MEDSDRTHDLAQEAVAPKPHWVVARALAAAAVFGLLGAKIGEWLGQRGNDPTNKMAEPIMKWSMGMFWGLLAAYSSIKASQPSHVKEVQPKEQPEPTRDATKIEVTQPKQPAAKVPHSKIETFSVQEHGKVQAEPELERI